MIGTLNLHTLYYTKCYRVFHNRNSCLFKRKMTVCGVVFPAEHRGIVSPAIVEHTGTVHVAQDEGAVLLCVSQGCPTPDYR